VTRVGVSLLAWRTCADKTKKSNEEEGEEEKEERGRRAKRTNEVLPSACAPLQRSGESVLQEADPSPWQLPTGTADLAGLGQ